MPSPDDADLMAGIVAVSDPVERARRIGELATEWRYLPKPWAEVRKAAMVEALDDDSRKRKWLAGQLGRSASRISQILKPSNQVAIATEAAA